MMAHCGCVLTLRVAKGSALRRQLRELFLFSSTPTMPPVETEYYDLVSLLSCQRRPLLDDKINIGSSVYL